MSKTSMHSAVRRNRLEIVHVAEIGSVRFNGRKWIIGFSKLRQHGVRGWAMTPRPNNKLPGVIVVSSHLPPDGKLLTEAFIHETLHAALPKTKEAAIAKAAHLVAKVLRVVENARVRKS
jgi:hypothetical protein